MLWEPYVLVITTTVMSIALLLLQLENGSC